MFNGPCHILGRGSKLFTFTWLKVCLFQLVNVYYTCLWRGGGPNIIKYFFGFGLQDNIRMLLFLALFKIRVSSVSLWWFNYGEDVDNNIWCDEIFYPWLMWPTYRATVNTCQLRAKKGFSLLISEVILRHNFYS